MRRRAFVLNTLALCATPLPSGKDGSIRHAIATLEVKTGGRLGVAIIDPTSSWAVDYRGDERFPMCSTFKLLAVAGVLSRVDRGLEQLNRHIAYGESDLLSYAPVTRAHVTQGFMTIEMLCEAALTRSDNTAANLLVRTLGGPIGFTRFARTLGDRQTRLDRIEPELNTAIPGDPRDTTTPVAMAHSLQRIVLGDALSSTSRARITTWLRGNQTGDARLRAGVPRTWLVGDKTGTGGAQNAAGASSTRNDVAVLWPPHRVPLIVTAYLTDTTLAATLADDAIAGIARLIVSHVSSESALSSGIFVASDAKAGATAS